MRFTIISVTFISQSFIITVTQIVLIIRIVTDKMTNSCDSHLVKSK